MFQRHQDSSSLIRSVTRWSRSARSWSRLMPEKSWPPFIVSRPTGASACPRLTSTPSWGSALKQTWPGSWLTGWQSCNRNELKSDSLSWGQYHESKVRSKIPPGRISQNFEWTFPHLFTLGVNSAQLQSNCFLKTWEETYIQPKNM